MARNSFFFLNERVPFYLQPYGISWYILVVAQVLKTYIATVRSNEFCVSLVMALGSRLEAFLQAQKCRLLGNALLPALTCGWRLFFCLWWPWHVQIGDFKILICITRCGYKITTKRQCFSITWHHVLRRLSMGMGNPRNKTATDRQTSALFCITCCAIFVIPPPFRCPNGMRRSAPRTLWT